jgi:protein-histidine N-methyltransferase
MTLCDYNEDVLRLATAPNILLNYLGQTSTTKQHMSSENEDEGDLDLEDLDPTYLATMHDTFAQTGLSITFISGAWGDTFLDLLPPPTFTSQQPTNLLILASETIYSPASTKVFADIVVRLLRRHRQSQPSGEARAWVAAKKVYFGVGGGVDDFEREIRRAGGSVDVLVQTSDTGVGRVVLDVAVED